MFESASQVFVALVDLKHWLHVKYCPEFQVANSFWSLKLGVQMAVATSFVILEKGLQFRPSYKNLYTGNVAFESRQAVESLLIL